MMRNFCLPRFHCSSIWEVPFRMPGLRSSFVIFIIQEIHYRHFTDFGFTVHGIWLYDDPWKEVHTIMNKTQKFIKQQNRDEIALQKYKMIAFLLEDDLDSFAACELRKRVAEQYGISERALRRYISQSTLGFNDLRNDICKKEYKYFFINSINKTIFIIDSSTPIAR